MIDNLLNLVRENAGEAIFNNPDIPNDRNEEAVQETTSSLVSGLQGILAQGGVKDLLGMFNSGGVDNSNPVVQNLSGGLIGNLVNKFGLDSGKAGSLVSSLLPMVLNQLISRTKNPADNGFSLDGLFGQLSGGRTQGMNIEAIAGKLAGGGMDKDGDGDVDLQDLMGIFTGGGNSGNSNQGGSPLDALKGIFGN
ncbi:DUF937 domain-containing protein [Flavihumibacter stibioxidans]|uniref:EF-hand domain-containing protein n=1 Tax=Flavihumibacter stibioxidans TaxID=1834163 RepID=A0ABR7M3J0_9BACT|nr:DUF937 domain-containing protein [Flavihumibacter stibioxidans]MBC6489575.1 hypothetical protein [Flavihumibacter stibioxidans]